MMLCTIKKDSLQLMPENFLTQAFGKSFNCGLILISNGASNQGEFAGFLKRVRSGGFGYIPVYGAYIEIHELPTEREFLLPCLFISNHKAASTKAYPDEKKLFDLGITLVNDYNQDTFLFRPMGDNPAAKYIRKDGTTEMTLTNKTMHDLLLSYFNDWSDYLCFPEPELPGIAHIKHERILFTGKMYLNKPPKDMQEAIARYGEHFFNLK